ncbi:MAG: NAD-dependent epimerase/dehydratase family protein [Myxococcaceae bacterium]
MTVLLTGATGLIGANLTRQLCGQGLRPRLLVRSRSDRRGLRGVAVEEVLGDILDLNSLRRAMDGVSHVYHLAGSVRFDPFSASGTRRVHVDGTRNVVQAARAAGVQRLVHVSGAAAIGYGPLSAPATETSQYNFQGQNPYQETKREAVALARAASGGGLEVLAANPSFTVGPFDSRPSSGIILLYVARGLARFYPGGGTNYVGAADVARGLVLTMEKGRPGERYILGGENLTHLQFLTLCAEEAGVGPPWLPISQRLAARVGQLGDRVGGFAPELFRNLNTATVSAMFLPAYYSSRKAERELGYHPGPLRTAVREAYRWFQEEDMLPRGHALTPRYAAA